MGFEFFDLLKILLAILAGGAIGLEREFRDKAAGFRTLIFICVGAALFTIFSSQLAGDKDPTRIAANIVSGVGFLGAGVILREGGRVIGLTTAAMIWLTAAVGMGLGGGRFGLALAATVLLLIVLWLFPRLEQWVDNRREERTYEVVCPLKPEKSAALDALFRAHGLRLHSHRLAKAGGRLVCSWHAVGAPQAHEKLVAALFADEEVLEFRY